MIIVEGPDGAGKTSMVERLEERLGVKRQPRSVSADARAMVPLGEQVMATLDQGFGLRLYDRFSMISSPMYMMLENPTFDDPHFHDLSWLRMVWERFQRIDPGIIFCLPPLETVRQNVRRDFTSERIWPHIDQVYWNYHNLLAMWGLNSSVVHWDYTLETTDPHRHQLQQQRLEGLIRLAQARVARGQ